MAKNLRVALCATQIFGHDPLHLYHISFKKWKTILKCIFIYNETVTGRKTNIDLDYRLGQYWFSGQYYTIFIHSKVHNCIIFIHSKVHNCILLYKLKINVFWLDKPVMHLSKYSYIFTGKPVNIISVHLLWCHNTVMSSLPVYSYLWHHQHTINLVGN